MKCPALLKISFLTGCIFLFAFFIPVASNSQTFFGVSSNPADNSAKTGPTTAVTPPGSMVAGDLVIIYAQYRGAGATISISAASGQTWSTAATNTGTNQTYSVFWCRFNGTWGANPSVTVGAGSNGLTAVMYVYRPSQTSSTWGLNITPTYSNTTATAQSITGITTTAPNTVTMGFWASATATTWGTLTGTSWSKTGLGAQYRNSTGGQSHTAAYNIRSTAGAVASVSQTQSSNVLCLKSIMAWHELNSVCTADIGLVSGITCSNTAGTLQNSTVSSPAVPSSCGTPGADVWYSFTAESVYPVITLSSMGSSMDNTPGIQLLSGSCGSLSEEACVTGTNVATLAMNTAITPGGAGLTIGATYYVRVYSGTTNPSGAGWNFNICITDPAPPNDNCSAAEVLTSGTSCVTTTGSLYGANSTASVPGPCGNTSSADVWYSFVAQTAYPTITLSSIGASFSAASPRIQLLSGACPGTTSLACINGTTVTTTGLNGGAGLTVGATYLVRITSNTNTGVPTGGFAAWDFDICITDPVAGRVDYSSSYINVTKGSGGGTVTPGDTLEIRTTFVVFSGAMDSLAFYDTLFAGRGLKLLANSLSLRTNEGKVYNSFTDATDADAGWRVQVGSDTAIQINMGPNASKSARGKLRSTSKPSFYTSTCIIMATYRAVVYAAYNTKINYKGGAISYRDTATGIYTKVNFNRDSLVVFQSPGLCPNALSPVNAVGIESNGTFGVPANPAPLVRNRTASAYTGYAYTPFNTLGGPQDYFYGITNNTSARFTKLQNWGKSDASSPSYRVFTLWDIIGDHTGASNTGKGNAPCDTTLPVSASNPCGYMLVINSAYKTDTAFQYTVSNLCPNTYYEISAWIRNICYKCGCDSNGTGAGNPGYLPFATGDSSGVQPNLAYQVNSVDYYTTGNIPYYGTTPTKSDTSNRWVKRGFTYLTGSSQSSFTLTIRNNAPGGGGNDWAMDDITVATCLPDMKYSPSLHPAVCTLNVLTLYDTVRSYFSNYIQYKWQRSTDGGANWNDIAGATGTGSPVLIGSTYQYIASYTISPTYTQPANNGDMYRLVAATTISNLANANCNITDGQSITISVLSCPWALAVQLLNFNGKLQNDHASLSWVSSREEEALTYTIEKSSDGINFTAIGMVNGYFNGAETNTYGFTDPSPAGKAAWYRITITNNHGNKKYSNIVLLNKDQHDFTLGNVINPFHEELPFNVFVNSNTTVEARLIDIVGKVVRTKSFIAVGGTNSLSIGTSSLPPGVYTLQLQHQENVISRMVIKQ